MKTNLQSISSITSFACPKRSIKKKTAYASLAVETTLKSSETSEILFGQFPLSLRFLASSKKPTPQRRLLRSLYAMLVKRLSEKYLFLNPPLRAASKKNLTKRNIKSDLFERRELSTYTSGLNFSSGASQAAALVSPFRQKVTEKRWK